MKLLVVRATSQTLSHYHEGQCGRPRAVKSRCQTGDALEAGGGYRAGTALQRTYNTRTDSTPPTTSWVGHLHRLIMQ